MSRSDPQFIPGMIPAPEMATIKMKLYGLRSVSKKLYCFLIILRMEMLANLLTI